MTKDTSWELWSHVLPKVRTKFLQKLGLRLDELEFLAWGPLILLLLDRHSGRKDMLYNSHVQRKMFVPSQLLVAFEMRITSFYLWCFCFTCESLINYCKFRWDSLPHTSFLVQWSFQVASSLKQKRTTQQPHSCSSFPIGKVAEPLRKAFSLKKPDGSEGVPKFPRSLVVIQCYLDCEAENDRVDQMIDVYPYSGSLNQMLFLEMLFHWWVVPAICWIHASDVQS